MNTSSEKTKKISFYPRKNTKIWVKKELTLNKTSLQDPYYIAMAVEIDTEKEECKIRTDENQTEIVKLINCFEYHEFSENELYLNDLLQSNILLNIIDVLTILSYKAEHKDYYTKINNNFLIYLNPFRIDNTQYSNELLDHFYNIVFEKIVKKEGKTSLNTTSNSIKFVKEEKNLLRLSSFSYNSAHIFLHTIKILHSTLIEKTNYSILFLGETSSGKSMNCEYSLSTIVNSIMKNYIKSSNIPSSHLNTNSNNQKIKNYHSQILIVNHIIEAFTTCKSKLNSVSSRLGKLIKVLFSYSENDKSYVISGFNINYHKLDLSILSKTGKGERNFSIFYQILFGASDNTLNLLFWKGDDINQSNDSVSMIRKIDRYEYLLNGDENINESIESEKFNKTIEGLYMFFKEEEVKAILKSISISLQIGSLSFNKTISKGNNSNNQGMLSFTEESKRILNHISELLIIDESEFERIILTNENIIDGKYINTQMKISEALEIRNLIAEEIYNKTIIFILNRINKILDGDGSFYINLVDLPGFDYDCKGSIEQLMNNSINEVLYKMVYEKFILKEQKKYESDGIDSLEFDYRKNEDFFNFVCKNPFDNNSNQVESNENSKNETLFNIINTQSLLNMSNKDLKTIFKGIDNETINKSKNALKSSSNPSKSLKIKHSQSFKGDDYLEYDIENILFKNTLPSKTRIQSLLNKTQNYLLKRILYTEKIDKNNKEVYIDSYLNEAMKNLNGIINTNMNIVYCINNKSEKERLNSQILNLNIDNIYLYKTRIFSEKEEYKSFYEKFLNRKANVFKALDYKYKSNSLISNEDFSLYKSYIIILFEYLLIKIYFLIKKNLKILSKINFSIQKIKKSVILVTQKAFMNSIKTPLRQEISLLSIEKNYFSPEKSLKFNQKLYIFGDNFMFFKKDLHENLHFLIEMFYLQLEFSSYKITSLLKSYKIHKIYKKTKESALKIQSFYKNKKFKFFFNAIRRSTLIIQNFWRGILKRYFYLLRKIGCLRIQRYYRGYMIRKTVKTKIVFLKKLNETFKAVARRKRKEKLIFITGIVSKIIDNVLIKIESKIKISYIIKIQSMVRLFISRTVNSHLIQQSIESLSKKKKEKKSIFIQKIQKGRRIRRRIDNLRKKCLVIQRRIRMYIVKSFIRKKRGISLKLQRIYRENCVKKEILGRNLNEFIYNNYIKVYKKMNDRIENQCKFSFQLSQERKDSKTKLNTKINYWEEEYINKLKSRIKLCNTVPNKLSFSIQSLLLDFDIVVPYLNSTVEYEKYFNWIENSLKDDYQIESIPKISLSDTKSIVTYNNKISVFSEDLNEIITCTEKILNVVPLKDSFLMKCISKHNEYIQLKSFSIKKKTDVICLDTSTFSKFYKPSTYSSASSSEMIYFLNKNLHNRIDIYSSPTFTHLSYIELPFQVNRLSFIIDNISIKSLSFGHNFCIILTFQGLLFSFGSNFHGELGIGFTSSYKKSYDYAFIYNPTLIYSLADKGIKINQVSCGYKHVLAKGFSHNVYGWGNNKYNQLGNGNENEILYKVPLPKVISFSNIRGMNGDVKIIQIAAGYRSSYFLSDEVEGNVFFVGRTSSHKSGKIEKLDKCFQSHNIRIIKILTSWNSRSSILYGYTIDLMSLKGIKGRFSRESEMNKYVFSLIKEVSDLDEISEIKKAIQKWKSLI